MPETLLLSEAWSAGALANWDFSYGNPDHYFLDTTRYVSAPSSLKEGINGTELVALSNNIVATNVPNGEVRSQFYSTGVANKAPEIIFRNQSATGLAGKSETYFVEFEHGITTLYANYTGGPDTIGQWAYITPAND